MTNDRGWALWLTGLPASGKTSLARALRDQLTARGTAVVILDSDEVRRVLTPNPVYTREERNRFYAGIVDLAELITGYDVNVIIAATASRRAYRDEARDRLAPFAEVWVRCPLEVCRERDPKELYARADAGEITTLPGIGVPYEEPIAPDAVVDSDRTSPAEEAKTLIARIAWLTDPNMKT